MRLAHSHLQSPSALDDSSRFTAVHPYGLSWSLLAVTLKVCEVCRNPDVFVSCLTRPRLSHKGDACLVGTLVFNNVSYHSIQAFWINTHAELDVWALVWLVAGTVQLISPVVFFLLNSSSCICSSLNAASVFCLLLRNHLKQPDVTVVIKVSKITLSQG